MSENSPLTTNTISKEVPSFLQFSLFFREFVQKIGVNMFWGDVGTGKTTLALQLIREYLLMKKKVFFCLSKQSNHQLLINRILEGISDEDKARFIIWQAESFGKQQEIINNWLLQVQELKTFFHHNQVGLVIVDEIISLYLGELGNEKKNEMLNENLIFQMATLTQISREFQIPIVLLNTLTTKKDENDKSQDTFYGGKLLDYWIDFEVKMERTPQFSRILFSCLKNRAQINCPSKWAWMLEKQGFI